MDSPSSFRQPRPLLLRLWHWLNALAILGALALVLLRKTFLSWRDNAQLIETRIHELGGTISTDDAVTLAKAIRAPMWEWHTIIGSILVGLLALRVVGALVDRTQGPVRNARVEVRRFLSLPRAERRGGVHQMIVKVGYVAFYATLAFMGASGLSMHFKDALGVSKALVETLKEAHELTMWFFVAFGVAHVVGVVVAELRGERGLVSDMIHGGEPKDP